MCCGFVCNKTPPTLAVRHITEFAIFDLLSYHVPVLEGTIMGEKERPTGANHNEQADRIQDSTAPVSSTHASTRNDERVSMSPRAEAEVFNREQHSSQTQPAAPEREASSVDLGEYRRLKDQVRTLTEKIATLTKERNDFREENSQLRESLKELQELKEKEEQRKEQQRKRAEKWRKEHPETHRAREKERKRRLRAEAARNSQPSS
jgi:regulator of replication initiation timing